jgi:hypothetical protein
METNVIIYFSVFIILGSFLVGFLFGWFGNAYFDNFVQTKHQHTLHPELYDEDGELLNEQLIAFRFENNYFDEDED